MKKLQMFFVLSLKVHWIEQDFMKLSAALCVKEMEGSHTRIAIGAKSACFHAFWTLISTVK